ncbi:hypothetical protein OS190_02795 [Sulfitobacter sp. F26204]|uniref:hypothetical protein n=1 Tax=Sulfitobacter sp. F26204 TaxID=2996014 RepID=UPI00225E1377|nr:hypothetical protein [Sulfitobacter sp. F26204]MCX7558479.1 hypothetical protein [Sulfitobacter sp. F26204]
MTIQRTLVSTLAMLTFAACSQTARDTPPTRLEVNPLGVHSNVLVSDGLTEQAEALTQHANAIVRASTLKGAMIGAAIGCGISVLAASTTGNCVKSAALGAAGGALAGNISGKQEVKRRVALASPNALVRNLRKANDSFAMIETSLPDLLARQDAELNRLSLTFASGQISRETHDKRLATIRQDRAALAEALLQTATQSKQAAANLKAASEAGHGGLDWHISATEQLARETLSARSTISLL